MNNFYNRIECAVQTLFFQLQVRTSTRRIMGTKSVTPSNKKLVRLLVQYLELELDRNGYIPKNEKVVDFLELLLLLSINSSPEPKITVEENHQLLSFDLFSVQSEMKIGDPDSLVLAYTQSMMCFLFFKSSPRDIGMIGLGGGSLIKFCYKYHPAAILSVDEINPGVIALRDRFKVPRDGERLKIFCVDGALFVEEKYEQFDVLLIDGFDVGGQPAQLCSLEFYRTCWDALRPDGMLVVNLLGGDPVETSIYIFRMKKIFRGGVISINAIDSLNVIVYAWKGIMHYFTESFLNYDSKVFEALESIIVEETLKRILNVRRSHKFATSLI